MNPSRDAGLQRLEGFLPSAGSHYQQRRNYDLGPRDRSNVSMLSPWLRRRSLLEAEVLKAVILRHGHSAAEKFIDEVFWRAYFRGWLAHRPSLWTAYTRVVGEQSQRVKLDPDLASRVQAAEQGATGNPAFDAWARELVESGYLHNHARMWFASIWVFTLRLPWVLGADFFLRHLLDGDPASNTLSWRWVSGLHTRGKVYLARRDNILKFTEGRLDPGPGLADTADIPEDEMAPLDTGLAWPDSPPDFSEGSAWLLTDEDATPPAWLPANVPVLAMQSIDGLSPGDVADPARQFTRGCLADALARHGGEARVFDAWQDAQALLTCLQERGVRALHYHHQAYGPLADALQQLEPRLNDAAIRLHGHVRPYDRATWPHAGKGFFGLKKRIPAILKAMEEGGVTHA